MAWRADGVVDLKICKRTSTKYASNWQKRMNKKYGKLSNIVKNIDYDIKHGANKSQVISLFSRIREESFFRDLQINKESMDRLDNWERELHIPQHTDNIRAVLRSLSGNADSKFGLLSKTVLSEIWKMKVLHESLWQIDFLYATNRVRIHFFWTSHHQVIQMVP